MAINPKGGFTPRAEARPSVEADADEDGSEGSGDTLAQLAAWDARSLPDLKIKTSAILDELIEANAERPERWKLEAIALGASILLDIARMEADPAESQGR